MSTQELRSLRVLTQRDREEAAVCLRVRVYLRVSLSSGVPCEFECAEAYGPAQALTNASVTRTQPSNDCGKR